MKFTAAITLLLATGAAGFVPTSNGKSSTALNMGPQEGVKKAAASLVAAAFIMTNAPIVEPAVAFDDTVFGSSQVVAARSGGRAGGRSSAARAPAARAPTRVIQRTTYVQPSPVIVAPTPVYGGYGYNPIPGLGKCLEPDSRLQEFDVLEKTRLIKFPDIALFLSIQV